MDWGSTRDSTQIIQSRLSVRGVFNKDASPVKWLPELSFKNSFLAVLSGRRAVKPRLWPGAA